MPTRRLESQTRETYGVLRHEPEDGWPRRLGGRLTLPRPPSMADDAPPDDPEPECHREERVTEHRDLAMDE